ncbi:hypothetical protein U5F73_16690 [Stenotrophomonas pavanii]|uniref:hypothetical protein n=1 Tax=Stenotrophomonas maltophilia group TaxID=995085 RepID=UPI001311012E|nr:hypothetical protein [Stenotrophomonas pavanii]MDZ7476607.1 hypothetical protein [Stenotrophomonas pavanii]
MPRSISYRPEIIDELISLGRIASYRPIFDHENDAELVGAYLWNANVCAQLYPLLQLIEVSLRNAIDRPLSAANPGRSWWANGILQYKSYRPGSPPPDVVNKLESNFRAARSKVVSDKRSRYQSRVPPSHREVLAKADFSTWEFILDPEFRGDHLIWPAHLGQVFRGDWEGRDPTQLLTYVRDQVRSIRMFRNRVMHHEPAWKNAGVHSESDAVAFLQGRLKAMKSILSLIHPVQMILAEKSGLIGAAERACAAGELRRFKLRAKYRKIETMSKLESVLRDSSSSNEAILIKSYRGRGRRFLIVPA